MVLNDPASEDSLPLPPTTPAKSRSSRSPQDYYLLLSKLLLESSSKCSSSRYSLPKFPRARFLNHQSTPLAKPLHASTHELRIELLHASTHELRIELLLGKATPREYSIIKPLHWQSYSTRVLMNYESSYSTRVLMNYESSCSLTKLLHVTSFLHSTSKQLPPFMDNYMPTPPLKHLTSTSQNIRTRGPPFFPDPQAYQLEPQACWKFSWPQRDDILRLLLDLDRMLLDSWSPLGCSWPSPRPHKNPLAESGYDMAMSMAMTGCDMAGC
jgi:hypothetical protein